MRHIAHQQTETTCTTVWMTKESCINYNGDFMYVHVYENRNGAKYLLMNIFKFIDIADRFLRKRYMYITYFFLFNFL